MDLVWVLKDAQVEHWVSWTASGWLDGSPLSAPVWGAGWGQGAGGGGEGWGWGISNRALARLHFMAHCCSDYYHLPRPKKRFPGGSAIKNSPAMKATRVPSLGQEYPLEKDMATHSSILAWRIPWTEEPGGLQSMGSQRVRHEWSDWACPLRTDICSLKYVFHALHKEVQHFGAGRNFTWVPKASLHYRWRQVRLRGRRDSPEVSSHLCSSCGGVPSMHHPPEASWVQTSP